MTLVAALDLYGVPILVGDIIVSQTGKAREHSAIPTRTDLTDLMPPGWLRSVEGVCRKVAKPHERLVVGWAGNQIAARRVVADLRGFCRERAPDRDRLTAFLSGYPDLGTGLRCELVGWLLDDAGSLAFRWDSASRRVVRGDTLYAAGSGADDFRALFAESEFHFGEVFTNEDKAIHAALTLAGQVVGTEVLRGSTLWQLYGGAIETLYLAEGQFRELDEVTFLFWIADVNADRGVFALPVPTVMKYTYHDECLWVHTMRFNDREPHRPKREIHVIQTVDLAAGAIVRSPVFASMQARLYCNFVRAPVPNVGTVVLAHVSKQGDYITVSRVKEAGVETERIHIDSEFQRFLHETIMARVELLRRT